MNSKDRLLAYIVPVLLICIALNQQVRSHVHDLSHWKGGGFGMFSSTEKPTSRIVYCFVEFGKEKIRVRFPSKLLRDVEKVKTYPSEKRVQALVNKLSGHGWIDYGVVAGYVVPEKKVKADADSTEVNTNWATKLMIAEGDKKQIEPVRLVCSDTEKYEDIPQGKRLQVDQVRVEVWAFQHHCDRIELSKLYDEVSQSQ